ncbi:MAG: hypothetical protein PVF10_14785, partial [Syntrophobacterales bacterium]
SQPCGHDLANRCLDVNGWIQAQERSPQAEALFPGRRLPAREKTTSSVYSVPLWLTFYHGSMGRQNAENWLQVLKQLWMNDFHFSVN